MHGFPRQEYWSGLSFPSPGDLPNPRTGLASPALATRFFATQSPREPLYFPCVIFASTGNSKVGLGGDYHLKGVNFILLFKTYLKYFVEQNSVMESVLEICHPNIVE